MLTVRLDWIVMVSGRIVSMESEIPSSCFTLSIDCLPRAAILHTSTGRHKHLNSSLHDITFPSMELWRLLSSKGTIAEMTELPITFNKDFL